MMSHGALRHADSIRENGANLSAEFIPIEERHIARAEPSAHGRQTPGQAMPVKAVSRRSRAREGASLDGRRLVRHRLAKRDADIVPIRSPDASRDRCRRHIALTS